MLNIKLAQSVLRIKFFFSIYFSKTEKRKVSLILKLILHVLEYDKGKIKLILHSLLPNIIKSTK